MEKNKKYHIARPGNVWQRKKGGELFGRKLSLKTEEKIEDYREVRPPSKPKDTPPETEGKQESDVSSPQDQDPAGAQATAGADTEGKTQTQTGQAKPADKTSGKTKTTEGKPQGAMSGNPDNENNGGA